MSHTKIELSKIRLHREGTTAFYFDISTMTKISDSEFKKLSKNKFTFTPEATYTK